MGYASSSRRAFVCAAFLGCASFDAGLAFAQDSGFVRGAGRLDAVLSYSLDTYDHYWVGQRSTDNGRFGRIMRHGLGVYAAYGLTDDLDLTLNAAWVVSHAAQSQTFPGETALQDMALQAKWRFAAFALGPGTLALLAEPAVKFPLSSYRDDGPMSIGDGNVDLRLRAVLQYRWADVFLALESGYDLRLGIPPDEVPIHARAGVTLFGALTPMIFFSKVISLDGYDIGLRPFAGAQESYDRLGAGAYLRVLDRFGVSANGWMTLAGKNTGDVAGGSIGLVFNVL